MGKKTHAKKQAIKSEIDDLFAKKKKVIAKPVNLEDKPRKTADKKTNEVKPPVKAPAQDTKDAAVKDSTKEKKPKAARFTEEGFRIYSTEDLNIGKGGDTKDCPFDCNCCF